MATQPQIDPRLLQEAKTDPLLEYMLKHDIPPTRENWMDLNYGSRPPEPWTAAHESEVPRSLRQKPDTVD